MRRINFDEDFDERGQLRDGHRLRVPMSMADGIRRPAVTDASGDSGLGLHRPGFRVIDGAQQRDAARDAKERAYALYDEEIQQAYKTRTAPRSGNLPAEGSAMSAP